MFSLLAETRFWTYKNSIQIKDTDLGVFRYNEKKDIIKGDVYACSKGSYAEERGNPTVLRNRRPEKLASRVRELEQTLINHKIVWCSPQPGGFFRLFTTSALLINVKCDLQNSSLRAIKFDRYLVGKVTEIFDVVATKSHFVFSHTENQLTIVYFVKPFSDSAGFEKLQKLDPKVQIVDLVGGSGRRLQRRVSANTCGDLVLTWWQTSSHEVYPWAPNVKDSDRANVHVYNLCATHLDLVAYFRTESEPICVRFSSIKATVLWAIEQKVSRKGDVTVESSCYHLLKKQLVKKSVTSVPLQTHVSCYAFSPDENRLALGCIDGSVVVLEEGRGVTRQVRSAFIPTLLRWHRDGAFLLCANDRAQLQFFDLALSCLRSELLSEDVTPSNVLDLGSYFSSQPALLEMVWSFKESVPFYGSNFVPNDNFLVLIFETGPLATISIVGGGGLAGDIHSSGLTPDSFVSMYLQWHQVDKAIGLLLSLDWNKEGPECLASLYHITNTILRSPLTPQRELQLETALGSFHAPIRPLTSSVYDEFADQVHDVTRRFFHQLVRHRLYEKAFCLAVDLNDRDLYLDLAECARRLGDREMALAVNQQVHALNHARGDSSCSCDGSSDDDDGLPPLPNVSKPPLPEMSRFSRLRESAFFSRNQPLFSIIPEEPSPSPPALSANTLVDSQLPGVIERLYDLPARLRLSTSSKYANASTMKSFLTDVSKSSSMPPAGGTLSSTIPYVPVSSAHFSSILGPSSSISPTVFSPSTADVSQPSSSSSSLLPSQPSSSSSTLLPLSNHPSFSFSSALPTSATTTYPVNPLSSHLYGVASKVADQKASSSAVKQKVKFSDTVTQIVVPDISQLSGDKPRRLKGIDPAKELADSLPLRLGNDYLKNFAKPDEDEEIHGATIKVIHFGVV